MSGSHTSPLHLSSAADFGSIEESLGPLEGAGFVYRRYGVPNGDELALAVAQLEGAERGFATSSGMGAISSVLFSLLKSGDTLVIQSDCYGGSRAFADTELARAGVSTRLVDARDPKALEAGLKGATAAMFETVSNPLLQTLDGPAVAAACRQAGVISVVDNTFATPLRDRPIADGFDLVVHSATKFLGGHHDLCAGVVVGSRDLVLRANGVAKRLGLTGAPLDCWLAVRGMRTLAVRMERAWANADAVTAFLREHAAVNTVHTAERCALVSFEVGDFDLASAVVSGFNMITLTPSLGGVATTCSHAATSSHRNLSADERAAVGISDGLLRLSIGIEDPRDLTDDLSKGLAALS